MRRIRGTRAARPIEKQATYRLAHLHKPFIPMDFVMSPVTRSGPLLRRRFSNPNHNGIISGAGAPCWWALRREDHPASSAWDSVL
jgi:hypothetical protein